jgi:hypothetical protein
VGAFFDYSSGVEGQRVLDGRTVPAAQVLEVKVQSQHGGH